MATQLTISEAQLISSWLGTFFWALFLVTFVKCLRTLLLDEWGTALRPSSSINWPMVAVSMSFFVFGTLDLVLAYYDNTRAFILSKDGPNAVFTQLSDWVNVAKV
jgi:hypothetical protein